MLTYASSPVLQVVRKEAMHVRLHERAEFEARDVTIQGSQHFEVPDGQRMVVSTVAATGGLCSLT
jgi:hypothetical protein